MLTLAELKRHANKGNMYLEMLERFDKTGDAIPENFRGIRKVIKVNTVGLVLQNIDGTESRLDLKSAKLTDYDGITLTLYAIGERKPTAEEQTLLDEWYSIEKDYYKRNPMGNVYWKQKEFFGRSPYPYMSGFDCYCGSKRYQYHTGMVLDRQVRGKVILRYKVHFK